jgi:hypothetical protein
MAMINTKAKADYHPEAHQAAIMNSIVGVHERGTHGPDTKCRQYADSLG